jgi:hypothetical protein
MHSFKRLSPYVGPNIPEWVHQYAEEIWRDEPDREGQWKWDEGSGTHQCELLLCDLDSLLLDPAGYVAIVPLEDGTFFIRNTLCGGLSKEDVKIAESRIFDSIQQAKAFLDSVLAFPTPEIPPQSATPKTAS